MHSPSNTLTVQAVIGSMPEVRSFIRLWAAKVGLDDDAAYHCQLAVDEACTNIIEHGYRGNDPARSITIVCEQSPDALTIILQDDAPPFNPLAHQPDSDPLFQIGGWGLTLIQRMMNEVSYHYEPPHNYLTLVKHKR